MFDDDYPDRDSTHTLSQQIAIRYHDDGRRFSDDAGIELDDTTPPRRPLRPLPSDATLYFGDNGACLCGVHLGSSARYTRRDISGQPITRVTPTMAAEFAAEIGVALTCEVCRYRIEQEGGR